MSPLPSFSYLPHDGFHLFVDPLIHIIHRPPRLHQLLLVVRRVPRQTLLVLIQSRQLRLPPLPLLLEMNLRYLMELFYKIDIIGFIMNIIRAKESVLKFPPYYILMG